MVAVGCCRGIGGTVDKGQGRIIQQGAEKVGC